MIKWNEALDNKLRDFVERVPGISWAEIENQMGFAQAVCKRRSGELGLIKSPTRKIGQIFASRRA